MTERIDAAREQMGNVIFKGWSQDELDIFVRLMQKFADAMDSVSSTLSGQLTEVIYLTWSQAFVRIQRSCPRRRLTSEAGPCSR